MHKPRPSLAALRALVAAVVVSTSTHAAVVNTTPSRFDGAVVADPAWQIGRVGEAPEDPAWSAFSTLHGGGWQTWIDRRSGAPLLVQGPGIRWFPVGTVPPLADLEARARGFLEENRVLFRVDGSQLTVNSVASGVADRDHLVLVFDRTVEGVRVDGDRFVLHVTRGRLSAFGASRWGAVPRVPEARYDERGAREILYAHMSLVPGDVATDLAPPAHILTPGPEGYRLAWRFVLDVAGEPGSWAGTVDATTGAIVSFFDDNKYAHVKGGVYPVSDDQLCPDGCEQPGWPMPYADVTIAAAAISGDMGLFSCAPSGSNAVTHLAGPYVRVQDTCGAIDEQVTCDDDLDLRQGPGTDCAVPPGSSPGNTHASRTGFYHLNRIAEKGRSWLPGNAWLGSQLVDNVNLNNTCNAFWNGSVNFYKSGNGCNNTGEIAGIFLHEWGHGLDANDGGGYDNPTEAYADVTALLSTHVSCIGRGFFQADQCSGYGDTCLNCTGIRDQDWNQRAAHTPATPSGFATSNCGGGDGPCGREQHCEAYVSAEAIWDLAVRDLPASGMDAATAWQLVDKLWYTSRLGSGGNAYNCSLPNSDGCSSGSWFTRLRTIDDDDGNLANGTPHAAAIFAAFGRHKIACGTAAEASNQSTSSCPALATPSLTTTAGSGSVGLQWTAVPNAASYLILRNDQGCASGHTIVATVPAPVTSTTDTDLPNDFTVFYAVQAQGVNTACESALSACAAATPRPFAGTVALGRPTYGCQGAIEITVRDANVGAGTTLATIGSTTETTPEAVVLTETPPGSARFVATIETDGGPAIAGDGRLSLSDGDVITARYVDADDGNGGHGLMRETTSAGDCVYPVVTQVGVSGVDDTHATVTWLTDEASTSTVRFGTTKPPEGTASIVGNATTHAVALSGLQACTIYWYAVESRDPAGNVAIDTNGGAYYHFETQGDLGGGLQSCHGGRASFSQAVVNCSDPLQILVTDIDLNLSPSSPETVQVDVASSTETAPETITLTETGANTSRFAGAILPSAGPPSPDGRLSLSGGDLISVSYRDADDGTGQAAIANDSALVDCVGATATSMQIVGIDDQSARVRWTTSEPTTGLVDWGPTPALGNTVLDGTLSNVHEVPIGRLLECARTYVRVTTTDAYGNVSILDAGGTPFAFDAWRIPAGIFNDDFEAASGWTLEGDWQIGIPQGLGTAPADPSSAFLGTKVLGQDLTGLGANPGDYEVNATFRAISPSINATAVTGTQLRFRRKLSVDDGGTATITVSRNGALFDVWSSGSVHDVDWTLQTVNLSPFADGTSNLKVLFRQKGGPSATHSGWTIDRLVVGTASQPPFEACGGCATPPSFAGALSAVDADPCADDGILVSWLPAAAWGTGSAGTYSVYRDLSPSFVPAAGNRIASGVTGTAYLDTGAPGGVNLHYLVRAENNESCGGGPANGGLTDANTAAVQAVDAASQPLPAGLGGSLRLAGVNDTQVRLSWNAVAGAAAYRVYRSASPEGGFVAVAETAGTFFEDRDQYTTSNPWYYTVRALDACGNEGP